MFKHFLYIQYIQIKLFCRYINIPLCLCRKSKKKCITCLLKIKIKPCKNVKINFELFFYFFMFIYKLNFNDFKTKQILCDVYAYSMVYYIIYYS